LERLLATAERRRLIQPRLSGYSPAMLSATALLIASLTSLVLLAGLLLRPAR